MKTLIFSLLVTFVSPALAAAETVSGSQISDGFMSVMQGRQSAQGQMIDGSQCSVSLQIGAGRSTGLDTITVSDGRPVPVTVARGGTYPRSLQTTKDGYTMEVYSIGFGGVEQELRLMKVMPGLFIVRAKVSFRGQAADSSDCFVKL